MSIAWRRLLGIVGALVLVGAFWSAWITADKCSHAEDCGGYRAPYHEGTSGSPQELNHRETADELMAAYTYWLTAFTAGVCVIGTAQAERHSQRDDHRGEHRKEPVAGEFHGPPIRRGSDGKSRNGL